MNDSAQRREILSPKRNYSKSGAELGDVWIDKEDAAPQLLADVSEGYAGTYRQ